MMSRGGGGVVVESWLTTARQPELSCGGLFSPTTTHSLTFADSEDCELWWKRPAAPLTSADLAASPTTAIALPSTHVGIEASGVRGIIGKAADWRSLETRIGNKSGGIYDLVAGQSQRQRSIPYCSQRNTSPAGASAWQCAIPAPTHRKRPITRPKRNHEEA